MIALDTNVLIYACDASDPRRQKIAIDLISSTTDGVIPWQVACEFIAASRKLAPLGFTSETAWERLEEILQLLPLQVPSAGALTRAQILHVQHQVSFWDAMILGSCLEAEVDLLYSEDVPGLTVIEGLRVVNPFADNQKQSLP